MKIISETQATNVQLQTDINLENEDDTQSKDGDNNLVDIEFSASNNDGASATRGKSTDDTVGAFFKEMARYPLLKPDEEIELAQCVKSVVDIEEKRLALEEELKRSPSKAELAEAMELSIR